MNGDELKGLKGGTDSKGERIGRDDGMVVICRAVLD